MGLGIFWGSKVEKGRELVSLFLHPDLGFWVMANNSVGVGGGSLVRL